MGYYVQIQNSTAVIPTANIAEAFERLKALNHKPGVVKHGGSYGPNGRTESWFSWMDKDYDQKAESVEWIFNKLGFGTETTDEGLALTDYDSKIGQEELSLNEVADLFTPESVIEWSGEDGRFWLWTPKGTKNGTIVYT
jgi:hypothetical protein